MARHRTDANIQLTLAAAIVTAACLAPAALADLGYQNAFIKPIGEEWSSGSLETSPTGESFLGGLRNGSATLTIPKLNRHTHMVIAFDLYVIGDWRGRFGKDHHNFSLQLDDGRELLDTSFANPDAESGFTQSYPEPFGDGDHVGGEGAFRSNTLGFVDGATSLPRDNVYRIVLTVPHSSPTATLTFRAVNLPEITDASWGLDNVAIETYDMDNDTTSPPVAFSAGVDMGGFTLGSNPYNNPVPGGGDSGGDGGGGGGGGGGGNPPPPPGEPNQVPAPTSALVLSLGLAAAGRRRR